MLAHFRSHNLWRLEQTIVGDFLNAFSQLSSLVIPSLAWMMRALLEWCYGLHSQEEALIAQDLWSMIQLEKSIHFLWYYDKRIFVLFWDQELTEMFSMNPQIEIIYIYIQYLSCALQFDRIFTVTLKWLLGRRNHWITYWVSLTLRLPHLLFQKIEQSWYTNCTFALQQKREQRESERMNDYLKSTVRLLAYDERESKFKKNNTSATQALCLNVPQHLLK